MNQREFYELTKDVRKAQKLYFKTRDLDDLKRSKYLEKKLDDEIQRVESFINEPQFDFKNSPV